MLKKLLLAAVSVIATMGFAFAQVDINKADAAALEGVKGVGPKMSKTILEERKKGGNFKDWADFETRVKGIGDKSSVKLSQAGLTVDGQSRPNTPAVAEKGAKKVGQADPKTGAKFVKKEMKKEEAKK